MQKKYLLREDIIINGVLFAEKGEEFGLKVMDDERQGFQKKFKQPPFEGIKFGEMEFGFALCNQPFTTPVGISLSEYNERLQRKSNRQ